MGFASALAWIMTIMTLALTVLVFKSSTLWVFYEAERPKR
jgi:multiple sugar transport system permease protein